MRLVQLELEDLPGLHRALVLNDVPAQGLLLLGPNGSGKTSLARGLADLIWARKDAPGWGKATWDTARGTVKSEYGPGRSLHFHPRAPALPPERFRSLYFLDLHQLSTRPERGSFEKEVQRELQAGFDLHALDARRRDLWRGRSPLAQAERERKAAQHARDGVLFEQAQLRGRVAQIAEWTERQRRLQEEQRAARHWQRVRRALELGSRERELLAQLAQYPPELEHLWSDEREVLERQWERRAEVERGLAHLDHELETARVELRSLPDVAGWERAVEGAALGSLGEDLRRATELVQALEEEALRGGLSAPPEAFAQAHWTRLHQGLLERRALHALWEQEQAQLERLGPQGGPVPSDAERERLARAEHDLVRWLDVAQRPASPWPLLVGAFALLLGAAFALTRWNEGLVLGVLAVLFGALGVWLQRSAGPRGRAARAEAQRFAQGGTQGPSQWTVTAVHARIAELRIEREHAERAAAQESERAAARARADQRRKSLREWDAKLAPLWHLAALAPQEGEEQTQGDGVDRAERLRRAMELRDQTARAKAERTRAERALDAQRKRVAELLQRAGCDPAGAASLDQDLALGQLRRQGERRGRLEERVRELDRARKDLARELEQVQGRIEQTIVRLALDRSDPLASLWRLLELQPEYLEAQGELRRVRADLKALALSDRDLEAGRSLSEAELERRAEDRGEREREIEELRDKCAELQAEWKQAEAGDRLRAAEARLREVEQQWRERCDEGLRVAALEFLLEDVQKAHARPRSELVRRADQLLQRFTGGDLRLETTAEGIGIFTQREELRTAETLSSASVAQLELALRIAVLEQAEGAGPRSEGIEGPALPLFLDEVLTHSDPIRFAAVVEALAEIAAEGRQIFFATSDPVDGARYQRAMESAGLPRPQCVVLAGSAPMPMDRELLALELAEALPSPAGLGSAEYGSRLGVPPPELHRPVQDLHVFHLFRDDLELVHRLVRARLGRVGPLERFLREGGKLAPLDSARFELRRRAASAALSAAREGRPPPVRPEWIQEVLKGSKLLPDVLDLARTDEIRWDGKRLLDALAGKRVPGLQQRFQGQLRDRFEAEDALSDAKPLFGPELVARALEHLDPLDAEQRAEAAVTIEGLVAVLLATLAVSRPNP